MAAKLLHSLADDNPDLQKQIGCLNGIRQIFDRHHMGRRLHGNSHKSLLPPGNSQFSNARLDAHSDNAFNRAAMESIGNKNGNDKRMTTDPSSLDRLNLPETPLRDPVPTQPIASPKLGRLSLDLRDVVKDSMHRESRGLGQVSKDKDSPRPLLSKSLSGSFVVGNNGKNDLPGDLKESLKLLAKFQETPWYEIKDSSSFSVSKDAPRYSYDGANHLSSNTNQRFKDLPRHSLDSRESSMRASKHDFNLAYHSKNAVDGDDWLNGRASYEQKLSRPPSVVAKLMGLETFPDNKLSKDSQFGTTRVASLEDHGYPMRAKTSDICRPIRLPTSPRSSRKEPTSPSWKHTDMKPISSSKCPMEPAPWKYLDSGRGSQKKMLKQLKSPDRVLSSSPSVYSEIEKRLKDLEFEQSGKDLRALKQILEAMEAKGFLGTANEGQNSVLQSKREDEQACKSSNRNCGFISTSESHRKRAGASVVQRASSSNACESSIVIMRTQDGDIAGHVKNSLNRRATKTQTSNERDHVASTSTNRVSINRPLRASQNSVKASLVSRDNNVSSLKNSGSTSPRLQRKLEFDKNSLPPTPDSGRSRRQSNRQSTESVGSPGGRRRVKSSVVIQNDDHLNKVHMGITGNERSMETTECQIQPNEALKCSDISEIRTDSSNRSSEGDLVEELPVIAAEHPSPISVLDTSAYEEDSPSPVKQTSYNLEGIGAKILEGDHVGSDFTSEINCKNSENTENLQKLNPSPNKFGTDYIACIRQNSNPVHRYVLDILSASGLLRTDLNSTFQLHQSGHLINPELFFVLEQTKSSNFLHKSDYNNEDDSTKLELMYDKVHRKLIFDAVNEILAKKFSSARPPAEPWLDPCKLSKKTLNAQNLLRELCADVETLRASERQGFGILGEEGEGLKSILWEELMYRSESWTEFHGDASGVVLDIERVIFRDLVDEVVAGDVAGYRGNTRKQCRRLLMK